MINYLPRLADKQLRNRLAALGAVAIEGPKACGKTATARQCASSEVLLDIDIDAVRAVSIDPRLVLPGPTPRLIDEWQRHPLIWDAVRRAVDDRSAPGQFILTGSAIPNDNTARHSGAGRITVMRMRPMTMFEQRKSTGVISLDALMSGDSPTSAQSELDIHAYAKQVITGGWPQLINEDLAVAQQFITSYIDLVIEHDIEEATGVHRNPRLVRRFMYSYAQLTAHPARLSTIIGRARGEEAHEAALSRWAADPYLDALRRLMIVDEIEPWAPSLRSRTRLTSTPKRHLTDPSLAACLLGTSAQGLINDLKTFGFLFESLVARDIRVYAETNGARVYHYREQSGHLEADLIVEHTDGRWAAFEVKLGGTLIDEAAKSLLHLARSRIATPPVALAVVTTTEYAYLRPDGIWIIPLGCLGP